MNALLRLVKLPPPCDNNMLCERCQRLDIQAFGRDSHPYRGIPLLSVVRSANRCSSCSLLLESLQKACTQVAIKEVITAYQGFQQLSTRKWLSLETLDWLRCCCYIPLTLLAFDWVNFAAIKAANELIGGSDCLNIASIDAFVGSVDWKDPKQIGDVRFHVAADPGEISLSSTLRFLRYGTNEIAPN